LQQLCIGILTGCLVPFFLALADDLFSKQRVGGLAGWLAGWLAD
jgi:hypothetical protein